MTEERLRELNRKFGEAACKTEWHSKGWNMYSALWNLTWLRIRDI